ncbi:hypothetical protein Sjap_009412 [Stephania japonica]|uniref:Uncharacterized protein n=1 Tax=Stephania japonica TaxID=461633 RepID=A0AAP0PBQ1_9MAGN
MTINVVLWFCIDFDHLMAFFDSVDTQISLLNLSICLSCYLLHFLPFNTT